jgi:hypothetical protein
MVSHPISAFQLSEFQPLRFRPVVRGLVVPFPSSAIPLGALAVNSKFAPSGSKFLYFPIYFDGK